MATVTVFVPTIGVSSTMAIVRRKFGYPARSPAP
jgi:hypothetical protein